MVRIAKSQKIRKIANSVKQNPYFQREILFLYHLLQNSGFWVIFKVQYEKIKIFRTFSQSQCDFESGISIPHLTQFDFWLILQPWSRFWNRISLMSENQIIMLSLLLVELDVERNSNKLFSTEMLLLMLWTKLIFTLLWTVS